MRFLSEARIALLLSGLAVAVATWQAYEARRANAFNREDLRLQVSGSPRSLLVCSPPSDFGVRTRWNVLLINNSPQPVVVVSLEVKPRLPKGKAAETTGLLGQALFLPDWEKITKDNPIVIQAKSVERISLFSALSVSAEFADLLRAESICKNKPKTKAEAQSMSAFGVNAEFSFRGFDISRTVDSLLIDRTQDRLSYLGWPTKSIQAGELGVDIAVTTASSNNFSLAAIIDQPFDGVRP